PAATNPRPRIEYDVPDHDGTAYAIATDKEASNTSVEIDTILPSRPEGLIGAYRQKTVDRLFSGLLSSRFSELTQKPDAPFLGSFCGRGQFLGGFKSPPHPDGVGKRGWQRAGARRAAQGAGGGRAFGFYRH